MQNETISRQNRVLAPIVLAVAIVLAVLILRPFYSSYIEKAATLARSETELTTKQATRQALLDIQSISSTGANADLAKKVEQLNKKYNVSDVMETVMLNNYTRSTLTNPDPKIAIGNISVDKGSKLPSGLSFGHVSVGISGNTMYDVIEYITYLTTAAPYAFTIDSISLPIDTDPTEAFTSGGKYSMSLSLGMYYYE